MVYRVVSTKLTEEEHTKLIDLCSRTGTTPSSLLRQAVMEKISSESQTKAKEKSHDEMSLEELWELALKEERSKNLLNSQTS